jgi:mannose-6-phosphate isomerase-like protein (cupin superfamily)
MGGLVDEASSGLLRAVGAADGAAYWFLGTLVIIKATGQDTGGAFTLLEQLAPPGFGPPLHVHHREDESFLVLEGRVRFRCGDREFLMEGGGYVFLPKGIAHAFTVEGSAPARLIQMTFPPGFESFVQEISVPAPARTLPPPGAITPDLIDRLVALGPKYHFSVVGPPLGSPAGSRPDAAQGLVR